MLETWLRPYYQLFFADKIAARLAFIPANYLTLGGLLAGISVFPTLYCHQPVLASFLLLLSGFFDTLDGTVARLQKKSSAAGCVLDIMSDRIVELSVVFGLLMISPQLRMISCFVLLGSIFLCVTSFLVVSIFTTVQEDKNNKNFSKKSFNYSAGLIERLEAFGFFMFMIFLPGYFVSLAFILSFLILLTAGIRIYQFCCAPKVCGEM